MSDTNEMCDPLLRTRQLYGSDIVERFRRSHVAVFGLGGVGGAATEALMRSGIGRFTLVDGDRVDVTNLNRQIIATRDTVGMFKTDAFAARIASVFPETEVILHTLFFLPGDAPSEEIDFSAFDYVVDAVDTVAAKVEIIRRAKAAGVPVISCMGTGRKFDPMGFRVADIAKTDTDPLAKAVRIALRKAGITGVKCVFSREIPTENETEGEAVKNGSRRSPGSNACVPAAAGLLIAAEILRELDADAKKK